MNTDLQKLAEKLGIAVEFSDAGLKHQDYKVSEDIIKFFAKTMGYNADTAEAVAESLQKLNENRWQKTLNSVYVCNLHNIVIDVVSQNLSDIVLQAVAADGKTINLQ